MKAPRIAFNKDAVLTFLLLHGEKIVVGMVALAACGLAWGGVSALRGMQPTREQQPDSLVAEAAATAKHIEEVKVVPDAELTSEKGLAKTVARWLSPKVEPPPPHALFNKPLFAELSRRSSPDILPVEDLRAVSAVAVLAVKPKAAGDRPGAGRPLNSDVGPAVKPDKPPRPGRQPPQGPAAPPPPAMIPPQADQNLPQGMIVPYVLVTGLIPVAKQQEEYERRFATSSFRDPVRDTPAWSAFQLERTEVIPGTAEKWTPVDLKAVRRRYSAAWAGLQPEPLLGTFVLGDALERRDPAASPLPFCSPMPQLMDGSWGLNALHPWCTSFLQREAEARQGRAKAVQRQVEKNVDVFGEDTETPVPEGFGPPGPAAPGMMPGGPGPLPGAENAAASSVEYRLFRFIDLAVVPGRTYRYRVQTSCLNPNLNVSSGHLVDADLAKKPMLESPVSEATASVAVPDGMRMLVQPLKKQELRRLKPGTVATMILGPTSAGAFGLRSLLMEIGGLANVDPQFTKRGDPRSRGEAITSDRVLLDVRGRAEDRTETRTGKATPPPEPLEMIFLRPDGTFETPSAAESQADIDRYLPTLQPDDPAGSAGDRPAPPPAAADSPFGNPFAPKK
jgi:hypothetical protein